MALAVCTVGTASELRMFLVLKYNLELGHTVVSLSTKWSLKILNFLTGLKVLSLVL